MVDGDALAGSRPGGYRNDFRAKKLLFSIINIFTVTTALQNDAS